MVDRFVTPFADVLAERRGAEPERVTDLRSRAMKRYETLGLPGPRDDEFRNTPVAALLDREIDVAPAPAAAPAGLPDLGEGALRFVFVNGRMVPGPGAGEGLPAGVRVGSLARALAGASDGVPEWLGRLADFESRSLAALNTAYMADGALVVLDRDAILDRPIHLVFATTGEAAGHAIHVRNLVVAGPGSRVGIVEHWVGGAADAVVNAVTEIAVRANATVSHVKLGEEGRTTDHLSSIDVRVERDGRFVHRFVAAGARTGRTETRVTLAGEGAECDLSGVYLARGDQTADQLTVVDHAVPRGTSRQVVKGILDGRARGIFNGLVVVRKDAQKTEAHQSSRSLVLSETADAHARPQLDISADDVKCSHGATVGALDESALFYLRSRGIDRAEARNLLVGAFAGDVIAAMPEGPVRERAESIVAEWLST